MAITDPYSVDWIFGWLWQCSWEVMDHPSYILILCPLRSSCLVSDLSQMPAWSSTCWLQTLHASFFYTYCG